MKRIKSKLEFSVLLETLTFSAVNFAVNIFVARNYSTEEYAQFLQFQVLIAFAAVISRSFFQEPLAILDRQRGYNIHDLISLLFLQSLSITLPLSIGIFAINFIGPVSSTTSLGFIFYSLSFASIILLRRYYVTKGSARNLLSLQAGYLVATFICLYMISSLGFFGGLKGFYFFTAIFYFSLITFMLMPQRLRSTRASSITGRKLYEDNFSKGQPLFISNMSPWMIDAGFVFFLSLHSQEVLVQYRTALLLYQPVALFFGVVGIIALRSFTSSVDAPNFSRLCQYYIACAIFSLIFIFVAKLGSEAALSYIFDDRITFDQEMFLLAAVVCASGLTSISAVYLKSLKSPKTLNFLTIMTLAVGFVTVLLLINNEFSHVYLIRALSASAIFFISAVAIGMAHWKPL